MRAVERVLGERHGWIAQVARIIRIAVAAIAVIAHAGIGDHVPARCDIRGILDVGMIELEAGIDHCHDHILGALSALTGPEVLEAGAAAGLAFFAAIVLEMPLQVPQRVVRRDGRVRDDNRRHVRARRGCVGQGFPGELVFENVVLLDIFELSGFPQILDDTFSGQHRARLHRHHVRILRASDFCIDGQEIPEHAARGTLRRKSRGAAAIIADLDDHLAFTGQGHFAAHAVLGQCIQHDRIRIALRLDGVTADHRPAGQLAGCGLFLDGGRFQLARIEGSGSRRRRRLIGGCLLQLPGGLLNIPQRLVACLRVQFHLRHDPGGLHRKAARGGRSAGRRNHIGFDNWCAFDLDGIGREFVEGFRIFEEHFICFGRGHGLNRGNVLRFGDDGPDGKHRAGIRGFEIHVVAQRAGDCPVLHAGCFQCARRVRLDDGPATQLVHGRFGQVPGPFQPGVLLVTGRQNEQAGHGGPERETALCRYQFPQHVRYPRVFPKILPAP